MQKKKGNNNTLSNKMYVMSLKLERYAINKNRH